MGKAALPMDWFVDGGQSWSWMAADSADEGFIEFDRDGRCGTSWGDGKWETKGSDMEVVFGVPARTWRLQRVPEGFVAHLCDRDDGKTRRAHGRALDGAPPQVAADASLSENLPPPAKLARKCIPELAT